MRKSRKKSKLEHEGLKTRLEESEQEVARLRRELDAKNQENTNILKMLLEKLTAAPGGASQVPQVLNMRTAAPVGAPVGDAYAYACSTKDA